MAVDSSDPDLDPLVWLAFAEEDLACAEHAMHDLRVFPRQAGYHAQQAAEKALKGLLLQRGVIFSRTHDLRALAAILPDGLAAPVDARVLATLTAWAVVERYPGQSSPADPTAALSAITAARQVVVWTAGLIRRGDG